MLIDPVTVVAQIVNFLILVALLKRFLYGPIIQAMEAREQRISTRLQEAAARVEDARQEAELYRQKQQEIDDRREELLNLAQQEVERERQVLMERARSEVEIARTQWYDALEREKQSFLQDLRQRASRQIVTIARRVLGDLANADLEEQIVETFIDRLHHVDESQLQMMHSSSNPKCELEIRTTFEISPEKRSHLVRAIGEQMGIDVAVKFEKISEAICGIELCDRNYKLSWNFAHYLQDLEVEMERALAKEISDRSWLAQRGDREIDGD
ncbi:MAG TPA: ATP F0F1 synthase subunit beta [Oscillatoriales cyanobacterium M59_W2019_021]|nr:MAG: ATP F0F1 synthase subunit beta [Cyanobacteria bacterium J055]HIK30473.1 ATP F0F1 synthase subunit beta [Oscillatoriales cyanobacterium M4454_W2019_049]HIK49429.1 ATP F0F1 synthase subunit beta [Oscillatoriales cyanobacterium M59_W2019_021]